MHNLRALVSVVAPSLVLIATAMAGCDDDTSPSGGGTGGTPSGTSSGTAGSGGSPSGTTSGGGGSGNEGGCMQWDQLCHCECGSQVDEQWNCGSCQLESELCNAGGGGGTAGGGGAAVYWECTIIDSNCGC